MDMKWLWALVLFLILGGVVQDEGRTIREQRQEIRAIAQEYEGQLMEMRKVINYYGDALVRDPGTPIFESPMALADFKQYTSPFGIRMNPLKANTGGEDVTDHKGVDMVGTYEARVTAVKGGKVLTKWYSRGYHNGRWYSGHPVFDGFVEVQHPDGYVSEYGHLGDIYVHEGQWIYTGQVIGRVNEAVHGLSTGPHLHFGLRNPEGKYVQPFKYVEMP